MNHNQWLENVKKELKIADLTDKDIMLFEGLNTNPFFKREVKTNTFVRQESRWKFQETFDADVHKNEDLIQSLEGGIDSLRILNAEKIDDPEVFFKDIFLEFIQVDLVFERLDLGESIIKLFDFLKDKEHHVSVVLNTFTNEAIVAKAQKLDVQVITEFNLDSSINFLEQATELFENIISNLDECSDSILRNAYAKNIKINHSLSTDIIREIAIRRAFTIVWNNISNGFSDSINEPIFSAYCKEEKNEETDRQYIILASKGLTSALAGYDTINIQESDVDNWDFNRRISRNIHHLLTLESFLDKTKNAYLGSYQIEHLAFQIAEKIWENIGRE